MDIIEEVYNSYGNFIHGLICRMVDQEMSVRPNLRELKELLKGAIKKNSKKDIQKRVSVTL